MERRRGPPRRPSLGSRAVCALRSLFGVHFQPLSVAPDDAAPALPTAAPLSPPTTTAPAYLLWQVKQSAEDVLDLRRKYPYCGSCTSWHDAHSIFPANSIVVATVPAGVPPHCFVAGS